MNYIIEITSAKTNAQITQAEKDEINQLATDIETQRTAGGVTVTVYTQTLDAIGILPRNKRS